MTKKIESNNLKCTLSLHLPVTIAVGKHLASFLTVSLIWVIERRESLVTDKSDVNEIMMNRAKKRGTNRLRHDSSVRVIDYRWECAIIVQKHYYLLSLWGINDFLKHIQGWWMANLFLTNNTTKSDSSLWSPTPQKPKKKNTHNRNTHNPRTLVMIGQRRCGLDMGRRRGFHGVNPRVYSCFSIDLKVLQYFLPWNGNVSARCCWRLLRRPRENRRVRTWHNRHIGD